MISYVRIEVGGHAEHMGPGRAKSLSVQTDLGFHGFTKGYHSTIAILTCQKPWQYSMF